MRSKITLRFKGIVGLDQNKCTILFAVLVQPLCSCDFPAPTCFLLLLLSILSLLFFCLFVYLSVALLQLSLIHI